MGFQNHEFDLRQTRFREEHLDFARRYWLYLIEQVAPEWLDAPQGRFAVHWESNTVPSAVRLTHLALLINGLAGNIEDESDPIFASKIRKLLFLDGKPYKEQLSELLTGALLSMISGVSPRDPATPIVMEPCSEPNPTNLATPKNVDYGIKWGTEVVYVEATVFHIQRLNDWQLAIDTLKKRFQRAIIKHSLNRALYIKAPLELTHKTLSVQQINKTLRLIAEKNQGKHWIKLDEESLLVEWSPIPYVRDIREMEPDMSSDFALVGQGDEFLVAAATKVSLKWPGNTELLVNKSLRNTLDAKQKQFKLDAPYLLNLRVLNSRIPIDGILNLIARRVFVNDQYRWISGINVLSISFDQNSGFNLKTHFLNNDKADNPLPESFISAICQKN